METDNSNSAGKRKKILYIITKGNFGGAQKYVYDLSRYMNSEYDVKVAIGTSGELNQRLNSHNIEVIDIPSLKRDISGAKELSALKEIINIIRKTKPNIIHSNSSKAGILGTIAGRIYNIFYADKDNKAKIIFTAHGWAFNEDRDFISKLLFYIAHIVTVILATKTIVVSNESRKQLSKSDFLKDSFSVIHNGIDDTALLSKQKARDGINKILNRTKTNHETWIGTISELHQNKGLDILIKGVAPILREDSTIGIYIIGNGEEKEKLEKLVKSLNLENSVIFLGYVENARNYLKAFDIFTLTSRTEGLPYVILEAGLAGLPIIATDVGGIGEIIENLHSGMIIRPYSSRDVGHAIQYALDHQSEVNQFGKKIREKVLKNFSIKKMVKDTRDLYISL